MLSILGHPNFFPVKVQPTSHDNHSLSKATTFANPNENAHANFRSLVSVLAGESLDRSVDVDLEIYKKLFSIFHVGDYYYYIFNLKNAEFDFLSNEVETVLGYPSIHFGVSSFMNVIHPDDISWFLNFENKVVEFFSRLRPDQVLKYKVRYDYRVKKANGEYIRILQQVVTVQHDEQTGNVLRTLGVHTDITHLKKDGNPVLSFIGMEGEPSFIDVDVEKIFTPTRSLISKREKEVLRLLIEGKGNRAIGEHLFISPETVNKHRRNMLRKTGSATTPELVSMAVRQGWV